MRPAARFGLEIAPTNDLVTNFVFDGMASPPYRLNGAENGVVMPSQLINKEVPVESPVKALPVTSDLRHRASERRRAGFVAVAALAASLAPHAGALAQSLNLNGPAGSYLLLTGAVDLAVGQVKNTNAAGTSRTIKEVHSNGNTGSQIRLRGREDLGDGLFGGLWLEGVMQPDTGTQSDPAGRFWNRTSAVYLGGPWGELALGRLVAPTFTNLAIYDPVINNGYVQAMKVMSVLGTRTDYLFRNDNAVSYFLPKNLGGLSGHIQYTASEGQSNQGYRGGRLGYKNGALDVGAAVGRGNTTPGSPDFVMHNIGGSYDLGVVVPMGFVAKVAYGKLQQQEVLLGAVIRHEVHSLRLSYAVTTGDGSATVGTDSKSFGASYVYSLSSRTALYTSWAKIKNEGVANFRVTPSSNNASALGGSSVGIDAGIRHFF